MEADKFVTKHPTHRESAIPNRVEGLTGQSLLHRAVVSKDRLEVNRLIQKAAKVNVPDPDGQTPLHYAMRGGDKTIIALLLAAGADITMKDNNNLTPLRIAALHGLWDGIEAFETFFSTRDPDQYRSEKRKRGFAAWIRE
jgi:ankyrin repeat protein